MQEGAVTTGVTVRWIDLGPGALDELATEIERAKGGDPLQRVTVVVPSKVSGLGLRRALAARPGGTVGVQFEVIEQVAEHLATPPLAAAGSRPLTPDVHEVLVAEALQRRPGGLGPLANNPETIAALARAVLRLRDGVAGEDPTPVLAALAAVDAPSGLRSTLVEVYVEYRRLVAGHHDVHDLMLAAVAAPREQVEELVGHLVVHLPSTATTTAGRLVQAIAGHVGATVLVGRTGDAWADRVTAAAGARLVGHEITVPGGPAPSLDGIDVLVTPDPDEEVRQAARAITQALHRGVDPSRIQLLHQRDDPYPSLVHEVLEAAGLPHNGLPERRMGQTVAAHVLTEALAWHDDDHPRARLMDLFGAAPIRLDGRPPPSGAWDRVARRAKVIGGLAQWEHRLGGFAAESRRQAEDPATAEWLRGRLVADADLALDLRDQVLGLAHRLTAEGVDTWQGWGDWALGLLDHLLGRTRTGWSDGDREAEGQLRQRLAGLGQLDHVRSNLADPSRPVTRDEFRRILQRDLDATTGRIGRAGVGVLVGHLDAGGHVDVDHTIILGAVEGVMPPRPHGGPFLPDPVVDDLHAAGVASALATTSARVDARRQALWRVLATSARTTLSVPRIDRREERPARPGPWVLELLRERVGRPVGVEQVLAGTLGDEDAAQDLPVRIVESAVAGLLSAPVAAGPGERRLAELARHVAAGGTLGDHPMTDDLDGLAHATVVAAARTSDEFTPWDGNLAGHEDALVAIAARPRSPSGLAAYGTCPRRWLFEQALRVRIEEEPRRWLDVDALDRGNLVHNTLEDWIGETLPDRLAGPTNGTATSGTMERLRELFDEHSRALEQAGRIGLMALWEQRRRVLWSHLATWADGHRSLLAQGWTPIAVERSFGLGEDSPGLVVETASGVTLTFWGRVDRMDLSTTGDRVAVYDYKTSHPDTYRGIDRDITLAGTDLQLAVYGLVARDAHPGRGVAVAYWHLHDKARRGAPDLVPFDDRAQRRTREVLDTIAAGIRAGVFPAQPGNESLWPRPGFDNCRYCPFTTLCPSHGERQRAAHRDWATPQAAMLLPLVDSAVLADEGSS